VNGRTLLYIGSDPKRSVLIQPHRKIGAKNTPESALTTLPGVIYSKNYIQSYRYCEERLSDANIGHFD